MMSIAAKIEDGRRSIVRCRAAKTAGHETRDVMSVTSTRRTVTQAVNSEIDTGVQVR